VIDAQGNGGGIGTADNFSPDRTNNVEQVSVAYLPQGAVAIEVGQPFKAAFRQLL
jgi:hypothetical protein